MLLELKDAGKASLQLEEKALELSQRLEAFQTLRMGMDFEVLPKGESKSAKWMTVGELLLTKFDQSTDPKGYFRRARMCSVASPRRVSQR